MMFAHTDPSFDLGQALWIRDGIFPEPDYRAYVSIGFHRNFLGTWMVDYVPTDNPTEPHRCMPCSYMTGVAPKISRMHGRVYYRDNGAALRSIPNPLCEA